MRAFCKLTEGDVSAVFSKFESVLEPLKLPDAHHCFQLFASDIARTGSHLHQPVKVTHLVAIDVAAGQDEGRDSLSIVLRYRAMLFVGAEAFA